VYSPPYIFWAVSFFVLGAVIGSFLNVVIARLPRGESIVTPSSRCTACGHPIRPRDNIPVLSYLLLGGRCRDCNTRISTRYPLIEFLTALLFLALYLKWGFTPATGVFSIFAAALVAIFWIDLDHMIIPDAISLNCIPIGVAAAVGGLLPGMDWKYSLVGTVLGAVVLYVPAVLYERIRGTEGLGGGDVKLLAMIGAFTGPYGVMFVLFLSSTVGSLFGLVGMAALKTESTAPIPFGPFLSAAAVAYLFAGPEIIEWLFGLSLY
jgi:leader peptidase (prepilin peptidase)/N-methyltransferase